VYNFSDPEGVRPLRSVLAGVGYRGRREGRQVEHVAQLVVRSRVQFVDDGVAGGMFRQAGRVSLDERGDHQLAVGGQTASQRVRLDPLRHLVVLGELTARQSL